MFSITRGKSVVSPKDQVLTFWLNITNSVFDDECSTCIDDFPSLHIRVRKVYVALEWTGCSNATNKREDHWRFTITNSLQWTVLSLLYVRGRAVGERVHWTTVTLLRNVKLLVSLLIVSFSRTLVSIFMIQYFLD